MGGYGAPRWYGPAYGFGTGGATPSFANVSPARPALKVPLRIPLDVPPGGDEAAALVGERLSRFESRIQRLPGLENARDFSATLYGGIVHLTGTVGSQREREMIGRLVLLEPGIDAVQNDLSLAR